MWGGEGTTRQRNGEFKGFGAEDRLSVECVVRQPVC